MTDSTDVIAAAVRDHIGDPTAEVGGLHRRSWSWQAAVTTGRSDEMVLKIPRWDEVPTIADALAAGPQPATIAEFEAMASLEQAVSDAGEPGLAAIPMIGFIPEINGILMGRFRGEPLRRIARRPLAGLDAVFDRTGRLVAMWHRLAPIERRRVDVTSERSALAGLVDEVPARHRGRFEQAVAPVLARWAGLVGESEPFGTGHGDLNLDNVLVDSSRRVALIDPNSVTGPLLSDLAVLIEDLSLDRMQMLTGGRWRPAGVVQDWSRAVAESAGLGAEPLLEMRLTVEILQRWVRVENRSSLPAPASALGRARFEAALRSILADQPS